MFTLALLAACSGAVDPGDETSAGSSGGTTDASTTSTTDPTTGADPTTSTTSTTGPAGECGDGVKGPGETCDGYDLGGETCADVDAGYIGGALACAGDCKSFDASACELAPGTALVRINEVTSVGAAAGEWAGKGDLIELYNAGDAPADLSGFRLSDDPLLPGDKTYVFTPGTVLAAGEWMVLAAFDDMSGEGDFPFGIAQDKEETLVLVDGEGETVDTATFDGAAAKTSHCRVPDGEGGWTACDQTFGTANAAATSGCGDGVIQDGEACDGDDLGGQTCEGLGFAGGALACSPECAHDVSGCETGGELVINELEATGDDIELYNAGNAPIDVSGWILTDDLVDQNYDPMADPEKLVFAAQTTIAAKGFLVVVKGMEPNQHPFGLGGGGDTVTLLQPNLQVIDQVSYADMEADVSYCRLPDGPGGEWTAMCTPTLGAPNQG